MNAFQDHSAKVAVWKAAIGDTRELVAMLRSGEPIPMSAREQLALLHEGKLLPKKRGRGRPVPELTPSIAIAAQEFSKIATALRQVETPPVEQPAIRAVQSSRLTGTTS